MVIKHFALSRKWRKNRYKGKLIMAGSISEMSNNMVKPADQPDDGMEIQPFEVTFTPLAGATFTNLLRLLAQNHFRIGLSGVPRTLYSLTMSLLLSPLNLLETLRYDQDVKNTRVEPPVFIVGHWRSGTTFLHNILSQDSQFGYPTTFQTVTPGLFLRFEHLVKPLVAASLPDKRPEDNVDLGADLPQEEEYAMGNLSPYAFYNGWCFPRNMPRYHRFVCMDDVSPRMIKEWKQMYRYFLQKVTLASGGKRLVVKNPANTARIRLLLDMFPDAKFVHIYRNPYHVYLSMKRNIETEMTLYCVQDPPDWPTLEGWMVSLYRRMFEKFFREKQHIPAGHLAEVRFEDLVDHPLSVIRTIYQELNLPGFAEAEDDLRDYLATQSDLSHSYTIDDALRERISNHFHPTIERWGYQP